MICTIFGWWSSPLLPLLHQSSLLSLQFQNVLISMEIFFISKDVLFDWNTFPFVSRTVSSTPLVSHSRSIPPHHWYLILAPFHVECFLLLMITLPFSMLPLHLLSHLFQLVLHPLGPLHLVTKLIILFHPLFPLIPCKLVPHLELLSLNNFLPFFLNQLQSSKSCLSYFAASHAR